jgi:glycosyltransferase involved in cell wall biosynthesis
VSPSVSVIIPTFNRAHMIRQAIDSVLEQTCPALETVVVDDGSTDDTESVVRAYGNRVSYVRIAHAGVARARNVGSRHASGGYLSFLDSDDLLYPYALELLARVLDRFQEVAFACAEMSGFDDNGFFERYHLKAYHRSAYRDPSVTYERIFERSMPLGDTCPVPATLLAQDPLAGNRRVFVGNVFDWYLRKLILCQNTVMVRREVLLAVGERNERIKYWEAVDLLLRICRRHPVCFVDVPTYKLRYHDGQISEAAGPGGKYVWMRKQQGLLRVTKRHVQADAEYYQRHRVCLDSHIADLHRAAAVPMLLSDSHSAKLLHYERRARVYLARCRRLGRSQWALLCTSYLPGPARRFVVTVLEQVRVLAARHARPTMAGTA